MNQSLESRPGPSFGTLALGWLTTLALLTVSTKAFATSPAEAYREPPDKEKQSAELELTSQTPARRNPGDWTAFGTVTLGNNFLAVIPAIGPSIGIRYHVGRNFAVSARNYYLTGYYPSGAGLFVYPGLAMGARVQAPIDRTTLYAFGQLGSSFSFFGKYDPTAYPRAQVGIGWEYLGESGWSGGFEIGGVWTTSINIFVGREF